MKNYQLKKTSNPNLFRVVDLKGDWRTYLAKKENRYLRSVTSILSEGYAKGPYFYEYLKNGSKEAIESKLEAAGDRGDAVHQLIAKFFDLGGKVNMATKILAEDNKSERSATLEEWEYFLTFANFWKLHEPVLIASEGAVANFELGYAGSFDGIFKLTKKCDDRYCPCDNVVGLTGLPDWKTSKKVWGEYGPQIAAYTAAIVGKVKIDYTAVLRLGTGTARGYEFKVWDLEKTKANFEQFKAALTIAKANGKDFDPAKEIYDIQESVDLKVVKEKAKVKKIIKKKK